MITCPTIRKAQIRGHYDLTTLFYRLLWGRHIHHGLWDASESPKAAQRNLTETLAREARIQRGCSVLDVGCGMGGSAIHLARHFDCQVTGITLSSVQRRWAQAAAGWHRTRRQTHFVCGDAEQLMLPPRQFDVVWSVECTEHLFDKPQFFQRAAQWLRPGGRVAICAWLTAEAALTSERERHVLDVCEGFFCPSLGSASDYVQWMEQAGLHVERCLDWTERVAQTWEICLRRIRRTGMPALARLISADALLFLNRFETIREAYRSGAMRYGCLVASKM